MPTSALRRVPALAVIAFLVASQAASQQLEVLSPQVRAFVALESSRVHIRGVRLIDGTGAPAREGMSVVVRDGRIVRVAPSSAVGEVPGATVVEGAGLTLIPGLVMLHEHLFYPSGALRYNTNEVSFPPLYLAGGVTTMRTGGSVDTYTDLRVRQDVEEGRIAGPHMDVTGPYLEGPGGFVDRHGRGRQARGSRAHAGQPGRGSRGFRAHDAGVQGRRGVRLGRAVRVRGRVGGGALRASAQ